MPHGLLILQEPDGSGIGFDEYFEAYDVKTGQTVYAKDQNGESGDITALSALMAGVMGMFDHYFGG